MSPPDVDHDVAVVGAGVAGTFVADALQRARPRSSIGLFERSDRIGGRLRSVRIEGVDHPIELGGMRFLTSHARVASIVGELGIASHTFDTTGGTDRSYLRGVLAGGAEDPAAGRPYALASDQAGRTATELAMAVFERVVPGYQELDHEGYARWRATGRLLDRPVTAWSIGAALETVAGTEGRAFINDVFGYDSGMRAFCAPDLVEFLFAGGDPVAEARTPDEGMDTIPRVLAGRFEAAGGSLRLDHELVDLHLEAGLVVLTFGNGTVVRAAKVVLATPLPALNRISAASRVLGDTAFSSVLGSVEGFPAMKLYLWYGRPWWRPAVPGIRTTTDRPIRKVFYFDGTPDSRAVLLGMYTDGLDVRPWADLYEGAPPGAPAPAEMLAEVQRQLRETHPDVSEIPEALGSALMYWGADPLEVGWHFWRPGANSDEILRLAPQPDPTVPVYLANEAFSRRQSWVEGALEAAEAVVARLA